VYSCELYSTVACVNLESHKDVRLIVDNVLMTGKSRLHLFPLVIGAELSLLMEEHAK